MALLLYGILEYRIREQWAQQKEPPRLTGRSRNYKPTGQVLLAMLQQIKEILLRFPDRCERLLTVSSDDITRRIVDLAG